MTGSIGFKAALIAPANNFVAALYDASNVGVLVESIAVPKSGGSYPAQFQVVFLTDLTANKIYRTILWESADTSATGTSRISIDFKAAQNGVTAREDLELLVGTTPELVTGATSFTIASLIGWNGTLENIGYGTLFKAVGTADYSYDNTTGTITLLQAGRTLQDGEKFVFHFTPQVSQDLSPAPGIISSGVTINANTTLDASFANKAIYIQGSGPSLILTLPALSSVSDYNKIFEFDSSGGSHVNVSIRCAGSDKIQRSSLLTKMVLAQGEQFSIFKANGVWKVRYVSKGVDMVGELVESPINTPPPYTLKLDGSLVLRSTYERLWDYISTYLLANDTLFAHETTIDSKIYNDNKGFFSPGDGSTNFRLADLTIYGFRRGVDGSTRQAGTFETQMALGHRHIVPVNAGGNYGTSDVAIVIKKTGDTISTNPELTSYPTDTSGHLLTQFGSENRPTNTGVIISIRI